MPKTYYTERDIEDLARRGVRSLLVDEDVALTDLAYEKARRLGVELLQRTDTPPAAPIRPYISCCSCFHLCSLNFLTSSALAHSCSC